MAGRWYNTQEEIEEDKEEKRYGLSRTRRHRLIMHILFVYLIIDIIADFT
jgi:hypothetical protein|tara:strand:- start:423 stop:572 length:150 start_codon:yes stop_codon:yes gene_type:complete